MLDYIFLIFMSGICILFMLIIKQRYYAYAIGMIIAINMIFNLYSWWNGWSGGLNENLTKIQSITNNIYGTVDKLDKLNGTSNKPWYYNNPVQKGANGMYKYVTGRNPKVLK